MTEVARAGHEASVMRYFVPISAVLLGCVVVGCGGLADDGPMAADPMLDPDPNGVHSAEQLATRRSAEPRSDELQEEQQREPAPANASAGQACGSHEGAGSPGVVVGNVELRRDALCGGDSWCLLRPPPAEECHGSVQSAAEPCSTEAAIPVPPPRSWLPEWQAETCTCRCDGEAGGADYCACPQGMRCAPLIPSAGVAAAARSFVGSYCVY